MTKQIKRFAPHQTAKVFSVLMALGSLPMLLPMVLLPLLVTPVQNTNGQGLDSFPFMMFAAFPIFYLVFGYISIFIGCWLYNKMYKFIGGFEFETE